MNTKRFLFSLREAYTEFWGIKAITTRGGVQSVQSIRKVDYMFENGMNSGCVRKAADSYYIIYYELIHFNVNKSNYVVYE